MEYSSLLFLSLEDRDQQYMVSDVGYPWRMEFNACEDQFNHFDEVWWMKVRQDKAENCRTALTDELR